MIVRSEMVGSMADIIFTFLASWLIRISSVLILLANFLVCVVISIKWSTAPSMTNTKRRATLCTKSTLSSHATDMMFNPTQKSTVDLCIALVKLKFIPHQP